MAQRKRKKPENIEILYDSIYYIGLKTDTVESQGHWLYLRGRADWRGMRGLWG